MLFYNNIILFLKFSVKLFKNLIITQEQQKKDDYKPYLINKWCDYSVVKVSIYKVSTTKIY